MQPFMVVSPSINPANWFFVCIGAKDFINTLQGMQQAKAPGVVRYINITMTAAYSAGACKYNDTVMLHSESFLLF